MLEHALAYAARGWRVFPVGGAKENPPAGAQVGKWPRIKAWEKNATTSTEQIRRWWGMWPDSNIGLCTGAEFVVLDIDGPHAELQLRSAEYEIPDTLEVKTGKGRHLYFQGDATIRNRTKLINGEPGVDVRGEGGYVVAPPSVHASGRVYEFSDPDVPLAPMPDWFRALCAARPAPLVSGAGGDAPIPEGARNDTLFRTACRWRSQGMNEGQILALLDHENATRCHPPLPVDEVKLIAKSAAKYTPDELELMPEVWGVDTEALKRAGVDKAIIADAMKVNDKIKEALPENGSREVKIELIRKWTPKSNEVLFDAVISVGTATCTVQRLRGSDVLSAKKMRGLCFEQGLVLPVVKTWGKLACAALGERQEVEVNDEETIIGACIAAAQEWITSLESTKVWTDFPSGNDRARFAHGDGFYSVSAKRLRKAVTDSVYDCRRADVNEALRRMSAQRHVTPNGRTIMLKVKLDINEAGA